MGGVGTTAAANQGKSRGEIPWKKQDRRLIRPQEHVVGGYEAATGYSAGSSAPMRRASGSRSTAMLEHPKSPMSPGVSRGDLERKREGFRGGVWRRRWLLVDGETKVSFLSGSETKASDSEFIGPGPMSVTARCRAMRWYAELAIGRPWSGTYELQYYSIDRYYCSSCLILY